MEEEECEGDVDEDKVVLITHIDFSLQVERKFNEKSMPVAIDSKFNIRNKTSIRGIWAW